MAVAAGGQPQCFNHIPNYNTSGQQHHRLPFKDTSYILQEDVRHHKWLEQPTGVRSRSELMQARQIGRVPDASYDLDRDGAIGQMDMFVGRQFDKDKDGRLTPGEQAQAKQALDRGLLDKYVRVDSRGKDLFVQQKRGLIIFEDNKQDVSMQTYPPHHNAHHQPNHCTKTALEFSRLAEAKASGNDFAARLAAICAPVDEPPRPNHWTQPRTCLIGHVRQRAEADHQAARALAGLLPMNAVVNPERELKTIGMEHVESPVFKTRGQLMDTRKEAMKRECEELAITGAETCKDLTALRVEKAANEYEFLRPSGIPMTLTRMKEQRRLEKIEYGMANFEHRQPGKVYPHFSDNPEVPFWLADLQEGQPQSPAMRGMLKSASEPVMKVTNMPFGKYLPEHETVEARSLPVSPAASRAAGRAAISSRPEEHPDLFESAKPGHVKRWSAEMLERSSGKMRLFDSLDPYHEKAEDHADLDMSSAMEPIRNGAVERQRKETKRLREEKTVQTGLRQLARKSGEQGAPAAGVGSALGVEDAIESAVPSKEPSRAVSKVKLTTSRAKIQQMSEPSLNRTGAQSEVEVPNKPRCFGNTTHILSPQNMTAVRCGGFHNYSPTAMSKLDTRPSPTYGRSSRGASRGDSHSVPAPG